MIRIHGDSHGNLARFPSRPIERHCADRTLIKNMDCAEHNIHVGDVGFDYSPIAHIPKERLSIVLGNHENYDKPPAQNLGDFGVKRINNIFEFFFVRGAYSIDKQYRAWDGPDKSWFEQEELNDDQMAECIEAYEKYKPAIVISHCCPAFLFPNFEKNRTTRFLEILHSIYKPAYWIFGHYHQNVRQSVQGTIFICISELCYLNWTKDEGFTGPF